MLPSAPLVITIVVGGAGFTKRSVTHRITLSSSANGSSVSAASRHETVEMRKRGTNTMEKRLPAQARTSGSDSTPLVHAGPVMARFAVFAGGGRHEGGIDHRSGRFCAFGRGQRRGNQRDFDSGDAGGVPRARVAIREGFGTQGEDGLQRNAQRAEAARRRRGLHIGKAACGE